MLRYRADLRTLGFVGLYFGLTAALWWLLPDDLWGDRSSIRWAVAVPIFIAVCVTSFQGAVSTHNAVHSPIFRSRRLNKLWQVVLTLTYGHPVSSYVPGHNLSHHKHTQSRRDVMRTTKLRFRHNLFNVLFFFLRCVPSIMRADTSYSKAMRTRHPKWFRQLAMEAAALWVITIGLFLLDWQKALVLWVVPHLYAQWGIVTMNVLQHDGCDAESEYNHSRNFVGRIVNWWTFNNGYHSVHHHQPGLHWSLTPAAHAERIAPYIHPNLDQPSLLAYIWRAFVLGKRETFDGKFYMPPLDGPDEEWIPDPRSTPNDLGAEGLEELSSSVAHSAVRLTSS